MDRQQKGYLNAVATGSAPSTFTLITACLTTTLFRIISPLLLAGGWSTAVVCINRYTTAELVVAPTLLTVLGTILGLVLAYRTSSAYDRYWEGRRLWSTLTVACRTLGRLVWVHVPNIIDPTEEWEGRSAKKKLDMDRALLEKTRMIELCLAFAVSVKHYLRGEDGIHYEDLYDLVKNLPTYNMPSGIPGPGDGSNINAAAGKMPSIASFHSNDVESNVDPVLTKGSIENFAFSPRLLSTKSNQTINSPHDGRPPIPTNDQRPHLQPGRCPPKFDLAEYFPLNLFALMFAGKGGRIRRKRRMRKQMGSTPQGGLEKHNIPLEITMYMSAFVHNLQKRKSIDVPTINALLAAINEVAWLYCILLPFQIYNLFGWVTIPATVVVTYILIGWIDCGQEIENPFGYDANDLNMDFFCENVIKLELVAMMSKPCEFPGLYFDDSYMILGSSMSPQLQ